MARWPRRARPNPRAERQTSVRAQKAWCKATLAQLQARVDPRKEVQSEQPTKHVPTLADFVPEYMAACQGRGSKRRDIETKDQILRDHIVPRFGGHRLDTISAAAVDTFRNDQIAKGLSGKTVRNHLEVLRAMLKTARRRGYVSVVPEFELPKREHAEPNFLTFAEAEAFLAAAKAEWRVVFLVAIRTGLRLGEIKGLRWRDLDLERATMRVRVQRDDAGRVETLKGNRARTVDLAWDVVDALREHERSGEHVFGDLVTDRSAWWAVKTTATRAGIDRHVKPHDLRHTFASHALMRGWTSLRSSRGWGTRTSRRP